MSDGFLSVETMILQENIVFNPTNTLPSTAFQRDESPTSATQSLLGGQTLATDLGETGAVTTRSRSQIIPETVISPDGRYLALIFRNFQPGVRIYSTESKELLCALEDTASVILDQRSSIFWSHPNPNHPPNLLYIGRDLELWTLYDVERNHTSAPPSSSNFPFYLEDSICIALSPDGTKIAGYNTKGVQICDNHLTDNLRVILYHPMDVKCVAFSPDSEKFSASTTAETRIWSLGSGEEILELRTLSLRTPASRSSPPPTSSSDSSNLPINSHPNPPIALGSYDNTHTHKYQGSLLSSLERPRYPFICRSDTESDNEMLGTFSS